MSQPAIFQRAEGGILCAVTLFVYAQLGISWWAFIPLWLLIDITVIGYVAGPKIGALVYNAGHSLILPLLLLAFFWMVSATNVLGIAVALVWLNHIGLDRLLGYGLKFSDEFKHTHLGRIGQR